MVFFFGGGNGFISFLPLLPTWSFFGMVLFLPQLLPLPLPLSNLPSKEVLVLQQKRFLSTGGFNENLVFFFFLSPPERTKTKKRSGRIWSSFCDGRLMVVIVQSLLLGRWLIIVVIWNCGCFGQWFVYFLQISPPIALLLPPSDLPFPLKSFIFHYFSFLFFFSFLSFSSSFGFKG